MNGLKKTCSSSFCRVMKNAFGQSCLKGNGEQCQQLGFCGWLPDGFSSQILHLEKGVWLEYKHGEGTFGKLAQCPSFAGRAVMLPSVLCEERLEPRISGL